MLTLWFVTGFLASAGEVVEPPAPASNVAIGGGAFALDDRDIERIQRALFPEDYPTKRKKKQIIRLEKLATEILNEFRPIDLAPYDMALVKQAVEAINMPVSIIREKPRIAVEALLAEAQRLAIEEDDEEVLALFLLA
jgi:hypothetical protein